MHVDGRRPLGIHVGTRLSELETMNGKSFMVASFGWDYGGNVTSWENGKLAKLDCNGKLVLTLDGERVRIGEYTVKLTPEEMAVIPGGHDIWPAIPARGHVATHP